jgi:hypothetical protein
MIPDIYENSKNSGNYFEVSVIPEIFLKLLKISKNEQKFLKFHEKLQNSSFFGFFLPF